jgi:hypothetical protein
MDALSFDLMKKINYVGTAHEIWESIKHTFGDSSTWDDGKFKEEPKEEVHECVKHDHNLVIVEYCSTSWSSDDDDDITTRSLDKIDDDATSDAHDDSTSSTLAGDLDDVGSCSSHDRDATTSSAFIVEFCIRQSPSKTVPGNLTMGCRSSNIDSWRAR